MGFISLFFSVILLNIFSYTTIRLRPYFFKTNLYKPMLLNFNLSVLPFIILLGSAFLGLFLSYLAIYFEFTVLFYIRNILFVLGLMAWLLALPNSGYLVTELNLNHRTVDKVEVPIWYDIISMLSFALSGVINTLANIVILQLAFIVVYDPLTITTENQLVLFGSAVIIIFLVSIGIYLGRSIRFNSWDILHIKPFFSKLFNHFKQKGVMKDAFLFILFHTILFVILYISFGIPLYFLG